MRRKLVGWFAVLGLMLAGLAGSAQAVEQVKVYLFYGEGCPHCAKEREYLADLKGKYPELKVVEYEIYYNRQNSALLEEVARRLGTNSGGVPFLIIGRESIVGFDPVLTPSEIEKKIEICEKTGCEDVVAGRVVGLMPSEPPEVGEVREEEIIEIPVLGRKALSEISLPLLTLVLGALDGFNPCAMWTLLFLISLLLGMKEAKRRWILGITFVVTSALVYFLFMAAWLNLFLLIGLVVWVRAVIGLLAVGAGVYYLRDYYVNRNGGCQVMGSEKRQRVFLRLREVAKKKQLWLAILGIMALAIAVNLVELVCSAGLPAIYTQVLSLSQLTSWQYYLYLGLYIIVFMLDDLFVFATAMITLKAVGVESKYARYSHFLGGILILMIGLTLLLRPEWLMFG